MVQTAVERPEVQSNLRAAHIVGSRAHSELSSDEWSDLDLIPVSDNPDRYLSGFGWLPAISNHWCSFVERTAIRKGMERRAL